MNTSSVVQIEQLTDELRQLVGKGAKPMRLVTLPVLRELSQVDGSLSVAQMGSAIHSYLVGGIKDMTGAYEFRGNALNDEKLRIILRILLDIHGYSQYAEKRRERVLHILGLNYPLSQMRRPHSPERELLRLLAVHLVKREANQTAA